jgi:hypothetical protein
MKATNRDEILSPLFSRIKLRPGKTYLYAAPRSASAGGRQRAGDCARGDWWVNWWVGWGGVKESHS